MEITSLLPWSQSRIEEYIKNQNEFVTQATLNMIKDYFDNDQITYLFNRERDWVREYLLKILSFLKVLKMEKKMKMNKFQSYYIKVMASLSSLSFSLIYNE